MKTDLIAATIRRRIQLGDVAIFDPLHTTTPAVIDELLAPLRARALKRGEQLGDVYWVGWSPITAAATISGAQLIARRLVEAAPMDDSVSDRSFWQNQAERLTWPMLHAAALGGYAMADVVRWIVLGDQPMSTATTTVGDQRDNTLTEVGRILTAYSTHPNPDVANGSRSAHDTLQGIWNIPAAETRGRV